MTDLRSAFAAPEPVIGTIRHGLALIAQLNEQQQQKLFGWVHASLGAARREHQGALASKLGIPAAHDVPVRVAATMMAGALADAPVSSEDFIQAGLDASAFSDHHTAGLSKFADRIIADRAALQEQVIRAQLRNAVLPTLTAFEMALDARVEVSNGALVRSVPIVVANIDTDSEGQVIWFQMDEPAVRGLRDDLTAMLDRIETLKGALPTPSK